MTWYGANIVMHVQFLEGPQSSFPVWENIVLIEADSFESATAKAIEIGRFEAQVTSEGLTWGSRPAKWVFDGVRKVVTISSPSLGGLPEHGSEITWSEYQVADLASVRALAAGDEVQVSYVE